MNKVKVFFRDFSEARHKTHRAFQSMSFEVKRALLLRRPHPGSGSHFLGHLGRWYQTFVHLLASMVPQCGVSYF